MDRLGLCSLASHLSCCLQTSLRRLCDLSAKPLLGRSCPTVVTFNDADTNHGACLMDPNILLTLPHHHLPRYHHSHWTRKETEAGLEWGIGLPAAWHVGGQGGGVYLQIWLLPTSTVGLPQWPSGKEAAYNAGDVGSIPGSGRSPEGGHGNPVQYSCLENPCRQQPGGLWSMGWQRGRRHCSDRAGMHAPPPFHFPAKADRLSLHYFPNLLSEKLKLTSSDPSFSPVPFLFSHVC